MNLLFRDFSWIFSCFCRCLFTFLMILLQTLSALSHILKKEEKPLIFAIITSRLWIQDLTFFIVISEWNTIATKRYITILRRETTCKLSVTWSFQSETVSATKRYMIILRRETTANWALHDHHGQSKSIDFVASLTPQVGVTCARAYRRYMMFLHPFDFPLVFLQTYEGMMSRKIMKKSIHF